MSKSEVKDVKSADDVAAVGVSMKSIAGSGKDGVEIAVQTHFPLDLSAEEMDENLDILAGRLARQRVIGEIPAYLEAIEKHEQDIYQIKKDTAAITERKKKDWKESGRSGPMKLSANSKREFNAIEQNLETYEEKLAILKVKLAEAISVRDGLEAGVEQRNVANVC
jgi:hypothetical protein